MIEEHVSIARNWPIRAEIGDYEFIESDCSDLIDCAQSRLMYGHRLCQHHKHPFEDELAMLNRAISQYRVDPKVMEEKRRRWAEYYENYKK